jgi:hypothetical protein
MFSFLINLTENLPLFIYYFIERNCEIIHLLSKYKFGIAYSYFVIERNREKIIRCSVTDFYYDTNVS